MDALKLMEMVEMAKKVNKSLHLVTDFISTHPQFLYQLREYAEKTGRTEEFQTLVEMLIGLMEEKKKQKEGKNG